MTRIDPLHALEPVEAARIDALLDAALDREGPAREAFVAALRASDPAAAQKLESLLGALSRESALDRPLHARQDAADERPADLPPGTRIGPWQVEATAGRGGMAVVYRARRVDGAYAQSAAIKLLAADSSAFAERLRTERDLLARLDHPHIARLLDGGVTGSGQPWLAMAWVEGHDLGEWLRLRRPGLAQRLALFGQVADAVAYAHQRLVLHRDLKPGNVRVTTDGRAMLLDFGIGKLVADDGGAARTLALFTPEYAAPEQLAAEPVSTLTDVHGLGVLLYELLAGTHPFPRARESLAAAVASIRQQDPPPPSAAHDPALPYPSRALRGDLDAIVLRCLRKLPEQRYASVGALREELAHHLARRPVQARRGGLAYAAGRWLRRHWVPAALAGVALLSVVGGSVGVAWQAEQARSERDAARREARRQDALRQHFMLVFRDGAAQGTGATAKQLLDASAAQLDVLYAGDPALRRAVLLAMGELYFTMGDFTAARAMLERFLDPADGATSNDDRARGELQLALTVLRQGDREGAQRLLDRAGARVRPDPEHPRALEAQLTAARGAVLRAGGAIEPGIALQREAVALMRRAVDGTPMEVGVLESNLGVALLQANRLDEARAELERALATWAAAGFERSASAASAIGNLANVEALLGRLDAADEHYRAARELSDAVVAQNAATAALLHNHARLLLLRDRRDDARELLGRAQAMAETHVGADSPDVAGMQLTAAELALADGDAATAVDLASRSREIYARRLGEAHPLLARADLVAAYARSRDPRDGEALAQLRDASAKLAAGPPLLQRVAVRGELWLAEAALRRANVAQATTALARAGALPAVVQLPDFEQAELRLWTLIAAGAVDAVQVEPDRAIVVQALGDGHPRLRAIDAAIAR
jgi:tetratricopeptide (TPR) repeat protein